MKHWPLLLLALPATTIDPAKATDLNAFAKAHARVTVEKLDVTDTAGIDALAVKLKDRPIDTLVMAIEQLKPAQNGKFYSLSGKEVPW